MPDIAQNLAELASHQTALFAVLLLFGLPLSWRSAGPPERAAILTLVAVAAMDLLVWRFGSGSALLHFAADGLALSWMLPVALRANRFYPAVIVATLLVAVLIQLLSLMGLARDDGTVAILVNALHLLAVLVSLSGVSFHRRMQARGVSRQAWRNQLSKG
jgi:hypothetical protein